jgi:tetratricopeptide (TPR) repeat protein
MLIPGRALAQSEDPELERMGFEWISRMEKGNTEWALKVADQMRVIAEKRYGPGNVWVALACANTGTTYLEMQDFAKAEPILAEALRMEEALASARVSSLLRDLTYCTYRLGHFERSETFALRSLALVEKQRGVNHPDFIQALFNLFMLYRDMGRYDDAIRQGRRILGMHVKTLGAENELVAADLDWLGDIARLQKDYATERTLRERAWKIRAIVFGTEDLRSIRNMFHLVDTCIKLGLFDLAEGYVNQSLAIRKKHVESVFTDLSSEWTLLGDLCLAREQPVPAEQYYLKALEEQESIWGLKHPKLESYVKLLSSFYERLGKPDKVVELAERMTSMGTTPPPLERQDVEVVSKQGDYYLAHASFAEAEAAYLNVLGRLEGLVGPDHPSLLRPLQRLATVYQNIQDLERAEPVLVRAKDLAEQAVVPDDAALESIYLNLKSCYRKLNRRSEAFSIFQQLFRLMEQRYGVGDERVGAMLLAQATELHADGFFADAEPLYIKAHEILKAKLGEAHPQIDRCLWETASMYESLGKVDRAGPLLEHIYTIRKKVFGPDHERVAECLDRLMHLSRNLGRYAEAKKFATESLRIQVVLKGQESIEVGNLLNELSGILIRLDEGIEAERCARRARAIHEKKDGQDSLGVAVSLNNLGTILHGRAHYNEAEPILQRALAIAGKHLSPDETTGHMEALGLLYRDQRRFAKAAELFVRIVQIKESTLGSKDARLVPSLTALGDTYQIEGIPNKAIPIYERCLEMTKKAYGEEHPSLLPLFDRLAVAYEKIKPSRAAGFKEAAKALRKRLK